ncbi:hypothetical protein CFC21_011841 [Triticum aestivum]|uniref:DUF3527 domain-containing protein n=3 Tax=Triticinae TaxID=1648030 RepID=A0A452YTR9_AEGTS|nr:uncharacterized protein LOC109770178 isoform X2 [Aegilops tauschii subsp. strangulata]XP_044449847.1 uncharacterized protein LOC123181603 isoform X2 [Triticum aestivum]KAF6995321.1 hypothetical protein CFC21_011841 [Triticum aestivum]
MGNRSRPSVAKETMEPIDEETESPSRAAQLKCSDGNSGEMRLNRFPNFHCKSLPSRRREENPEDSIMHSRGSMYQSSSDVSRLRKLQEGRRKLDSIYERDAFMSFGTVDSSSQPSTSGSYLVPQRSGSCKSRSSMNITRGFNQDAREFLDISSREVPSDNLRLGRPRKDCNLLKDDVKESFPGLSLEEDNAMCPAANAAPHLLESSSSKGTMSNGQPPVGLHPDRSNHARIDSVSNLPKSLSAKVGVFDATCPSESVHGVDGKKKARSSAFKKILDPFMKSKSMRNPSLMEMEDAKCGNPPVRGKDSALRKSLLSGISRSEQTPTPKCQMSGEARPITVTSSPTHLHAVLKLDPDNGAFGFEFCTKGPEESIYANTWKSGNELNWIYTFHSVGKRSSTVARTSKDRHGWLPPIVGQMHVSSYLYSEVEEDGILNNSATSEFVLYDIAHARRSSAVDRVQSTDSTQPPFCNVVKNSISRESLERNNQMERQNTARNNSDASVSCLWSQEDLHPHLEVAAVVVQVPFHKTRSQELKTGSSPGTVKVVTAGGAHGLPRDDETSPSPLLNRLKSGGRCDCGGWDMSCPIVVLENAYDSYWVDSVMNESKHPMELFVKGNQEVLPALSMKVDGKGNFSVDFHARLSALQAFSVCISLLHCSEASPAIGIEKFKHKLYSSSMKMLLKEEVKQLIGSVTGKEKKKVKRRKAKTPVVNGPPFSPMGRV